MQRMRVAEMRMIHWICGHTRLDNIRNEVIRDKIKVASIEYKMRDARSRWFLAYKEAEGCAREKM